MRKTKQQEIDRLNEKIRDLNLRLDCQRRTIQALGEALDEARKEVKIEIDLSSDVDINKESLLRCIKEFVERRI